MMPPKVAVQGFQCTHTKKTQKHNKPPNPKWNVYHFKNLDDQIPSSIYF